MGFLYQPEESESAVDIMPNPLAVKEGVTRTYVTHTAHTKALGRAGFGGRREGVQDDGAGGGRFVMYTSFFILSGASTDHTHTRARARRAQTQASILS